MSSQRLHIIALDVPFPADYGGAIDMFYRIKGLHDSGVQVVLHCFEYGRGEQKVLENITAEVHYYRREKKLISWFSGLPFIVKTRASKALLENLLKDDAPILFEGLHTCYHLSDERLENRIKLVRTHNVEHDYYRGLALQATGSKRTYFKSEAKKLEKFESILAHANHILAIQQNDLVHFRRLNKNVHLLPASSPDVGNNTMVDTDPICLLHGNLSVLENETAARWVIDALAPIKDQLIVAGKEPSQSLVDLCLRESIQLVTNPTDHEMNALLQQARVHVLYTEQSTGLKLKLINSLNTSGHVLVNEKMIEGTTLKPYCNVANTAEEYLAQTTQLLTSSLSRSDFENRQQFLSQHYPNKKSAELIVSLISG